MSYWKMGLIGVVALVFLARPPDRRTTRSGEHLPPLLPRPEVLTSLGAGFKSLIADYFWVQTLQAVSLANTPDEFRDIYDYAVLVATIDPQFEPVYVFAGATIPVQDRKKQWHNTKESTELLELGVKRFPNQVFMRILLAYNLANFEHQYARAAENLIAASKLPHAPKYLTALATRLYAQAGDFDAGLALAQSILDTTNDEKTHELFEKRVKELELERTLRFLDGLLQKYQQQFGHPATHLDELVRAGLIAHLPPDPMGGVLEVGADGRTRSSAETQRLELHPEISP
jgi:hypothetical protein